MGAEALEREDGKGKPGDAPERTCVVTRRKLGPDELIRFVRAPDGVVVADLAGKLPGRGVWVSSDRVNVMAAAKANAFARGLKQPVTVPGDLAGQVEQMLRRRLAEALSFCVKAGVAVAGFTKVENAVDKGEAFVLLHASDAAEDGRGKLDRKFKMIRAALAPDAAAEIVSELTSGELSLAMGRLHVVHAALRKGGAAQNFLKAARRLQRYQSPSMSEAARPPILSLDTDNV